MRSPSRVEWPTIGVAGLIATGVGALAATHDRFPAVLTIAALAVLSAWYGSLRHEIVHGHPTPWRQLNTALAAVPLNLIEPFWRYREDHLAHHLTDDLTNPLRDPESQYLRAAEWADAGRVRRAVRRANTTLAGRMVIGPWIVAASSVRALCERWRRGEGRPAIVRFVVADIGVLLVVRWAGMPVWQFLVGAVYLGGSITAVRSYAEHRAVVEGSRTAVVHGGWFWATLFLNNNLHVTHHHRPGLPWYEIPAAHAASDADRLAAEGAGLYSGYGEIFRRFLFHPVCDAVDPLDRESLISA